MWVHHLSKALQQLHLGVAEGVLVRAVEALQLLALGVNELCPVVVGQVPLLPPGGMPCRAEGRTGSMSACWKVLPGAWVGIRLAHMREVGRSTASAAAAAAALPANLDVLVARMQGKDAGPPGKECSCWETGMMSNG